MQVKKQQLEPNMEQWNSSKLEKKYIEALYGNTAYLAYMYITSSFFFFLVLILKGLLGLHKTIKLQLLQCY